MNSRPFTVGIASGKGGTGKTSLATSLARVATERGRSVILVDGDVDAPNAALFLPAEIADSRVVSALIPEVDPSVCTLCGDCAKVCRYKAIAVLGPTVLVFPELCHGCGGCRIVCPVGAITEVEHRVGEVRRRPGLEYNLVEGILDIGEVKAPLLIQEALREAGAWDRRADLRLIDSPPGTSCAVVACLTEADYLLLVTEPTPFGLHDLKLAVKLGRTMDLPMGVVLNRDGSGDTDIAGFCHEAGVPLLVRIPFSRQVAGAYAQGQDLLSSSAEWSAAINLLYESLAAFETQMRGTVDMSSVSDGGES